MGGSDIRFELRGLTEVHAALKAIDRDAPKELREGFLPVITDVAGRIRETVPRVTGKAAMSIRPRASQKGAGIAFSDSDGTVPYYPWLDFGGTVGRGGGQVRPFIKGGRYVYPGILSSMDDIEERAEEVMERLGRKHGFETRKGIG